MKQKSNSFMSSLFRLYSPATWASVVVEDLHTLSSSARLGGGGGGPPKKKKREGPGGGGVPPPKKKKEERGGGQFFFFFGGTPPSPAVSRNSSMEIFCLLSVSIGTV